MADRQFPVGPAPRLYQRACEMMAAEISAGGLTGGTDLTETAVAKRYGISRAPARQALAELATRGLVRKSEGRGYHVVGPATPEGDAGTAPPSAGARIHFLASWERIYGQVEADIVSRTALASWRINEALLARSFDVSRTVAREVIARLQQRGVVAKDDAGRWHAPGLTVRHITQLYELRGILEPLALEQAFPRLPARLVAELLRDLEDAIGAGKSADGDMLDAVEQRLHVELLGYCDNPPLMQAISLPQAVLVAHHRLYQPQGLAMEEEPFLLEHREILTRLSNGDVTGARQALAGHLEISRERAMMRISRAALSLSLPDLPYLERLGTVEFNR